MTLGKIKRYVRTDICDKLMDGVGLDRWACDLHHFTCNEDYFVIGFCKAKSMLGGDAFDAIKVIQEYEQDNFGEVTTKLSDPEKVINMLAYIMGEEILQSSKHLMNNYNKILTKEDLEIIGEELLNS